MTTEKLEANATQTPEAENPGTSSAKKGTKTSTPKAKEEVALAVPSKYEYTSGGIKLLRQPDGLPGNRPIEASHLKIVSTYISVGGTRPVVASGMEIKGTLTVSGARPIAASHLHISETYTVMGNRPVASNEIDDPVSLMGFLD